MIFGTYENPETWSGHCGFDEPREQRLKEMLLLKDVHKEANLRSSDAKSALAEGDLIFLDIPVFLFRKVAQSTESWTSHVGIAFKDSKGRWMVSESKVLFAKEVPLLQYLARSADGRFEIKRLRRSLSVEEIETLRQAAKSNHGQLYGLGFNLNSKRQFCSKHVYQAYCAIGIKVGQVQTFKELLESDPHSPAIRFWKLWFFGFVPWSRETITPASQLNDAQFFSVMNSHQSRKNL
jgi:hypothetical protein